MQLSKLFAIHHPAIAFNSLLITDLGKNIRIGNKILQKKNDLLTEIKQIKNLNIWLIFHIGELIGLPQKRLIILDSKYNYILKKLDKHIWVETSEVKIETKRSYYVCGVTVPKLFEPEVEYLKPVFAFLEDQIVHIGFSNSSVKKEIKW